MVIQQMSRLTDGAFTKISLLHEPIVSSLPTVDTNSYFLCCGAMVSENEFMEDLYNLHF